jgi:hypothetical protein
MEAGRLSKARWRTYWLALVLCCGGALFGYDSGVIGNYHHSQFLHSNFTNEPRLTYYQAES